VSGFIGWLMWLVLHLLALTGFKNRVAVLSNWTIALLGQGRPQRAITAQQVFARQALERQAVDAGSGAIGCAPSSGSRPEAGVP